MQTVLEGREDFEDDARYRSLTASITMDNLKKLNRLCLIIKKRYQRKDYRSINFIWVMGGDLNLLFPF